MVFRRKPVGSLFGSDKNDSRFPSLQPGLNVRFNVSKRRGNRAITNQVNIALYSVRASHDVRTSTGLTNALPFTRRRYTFHVTASILFDTPHYSVLFYLTADNVSFLFHTVYGILLNIFCFIIYSGLFEQSFDVSRSTRTYTEWNLLNNVTPTIETVSMVNYYRRCQYATIINMVFVNYLMHVCLKKYYITN